MPVRVGPAHERGTGKTEGFPSQSMTIGIDASRPNERQKTGTEWYAYHIIQQLKKIDHKNSYRLYSMDALQDGLEELPSNFEGRVLRSVTDLLWTQLRLTLEMVTQPPDVLFVPAHTIPIFHPLATVLTVHDLGFEYFPDLYRHVPIGPPHPVIRGALNLAAKLATLGRYGNSELDYHRWAMRFGIKHAAHIIAISEFTKKDLVVRFNANPDNITVVPHAYDPKLYYPARRNGPASDLVKKMLPFFLFVGRVEKKKNIGTLLAGYERFRKNATAGPKLVLIGKPGYGFDEYAKQVASFPGHIRQDIHFLGWLPEEMTAEFYRYARAFLFPTNFEGFGIGVIQAMASGVPVVASNVTSLPEVAGGAALLVDPTKQDALTSAMRQVQSPAVRRILIVKGLKRAKDFSWEKSARSTLRVLEKVYDESRLRP